MWIVLRWLKWNSLPIGIPLMPLLLIILPIVASYIDTNNRKLWVQLDSLEDIRSKYKSVSFVCLISK